jgi:hypothetical protein
MQLAVDNNKNGGYVVHPKKICTLGCMWQYSNDFFVAYERLFG